MALTLLYGAPGEKHEERIYDELIRESMAHPEQTYLMLVPEQASLSVQEELVNRHPRHALSNVDVLTFRRLAYRVFKETGTSTRDILDDEGKMLFLQLAVRNRRPELGVLKRNVEKIGTLMALKSMFSEFAEYSVTPELLREKTALLPAEDRLRRKMDDIGLLYEEFLRLAHEKFDLSEELLSVLAKTVSSWAALPGVTVAFDGFTGFTPPEYEVVEALIRGANAVIFGFTVGTAYKEAENRNPEDLFYMPAHAAEKIKELAIRNSVPYTEHTLLEGHDTRPEALRYAEKHLFGVAEAPSTEETDAIRVVRARTFREEIRFVTREVMRLVREGYRYRDLAIVTGDFEAYREDLEAELRDAGLPYFLDANKPLLNSAAIRFVTDALWIVRDNFAYDAVFSFLKNPIVLWSGGEKTTADRISELENFAAARGFRSRSGYGKTWEGGYRYFLPERLPFVLETKAAVIEPLLTFYDRMEKKHPTVSDRVAALKDLLLAYRAEETLQELGETVEKETGEALQKEYASLYEFLLTYLDRMAEILGDMEIQTSFFEDLVCAGLSQAELTRVPPTKDRLIVGNLTRTRLQHVKKLIVLGANEGKLPLKPAGGGVLNDFERQTLKSLDVMLAETAEENTFNNRYYLYLLFNEPAESLTLSYAAAKNDGEGLQPADILRAVRALFPKVSEEDAENGLFSDVASKESALLALSGTLSALRRKEDLPDPDAASERAKGLYQWFSKEADEKASLQPIRNGLFYEYRPESLPKELAEAIFGERIEGSVSRMEGFAECPYRHFLHYGLEIHPRVLFELNRADIGTIAHGSIEVFFRTLQESGKDWASLTEEEQNKLIENAVAEVTAAYGNDIFADSTRNEFLAGRIRRIMKRTIWALSNQWKSGAYEKTESEVKFHDEDFSEGKDGKLALSGRIDRIDLAKDEDRVFVKIIDYKSSNKPLDFTKVYHGLQLQLLLYMQVALAREKKRNPGKEVEPAGLYYYTVTDPLVSEVPDEDLDREILKELRMHGLTLNDPEAISLLDNTLLSGGESAVVKDLAQKDAEFKGSGVLKAEEIKALGEFAVRKTGKLADEIRSGRIDASPYALGNQTGCEFCDYKAVCGRDRRVRKKEENWLEKKELKDILGGEDAEVDS